MKGFETKEFLRFEQRYAVRVQYILDLRTERVAKSVRRGRLTSGQDQKNLPTRQEIVKTDEPMSDAKLAALAFAVSLGAVAFYRWVIFFPLYSRSATVTHFWAPGFILLSLGVSAAAYRQCQGKLRWVSVISCFLIVSQFLPWFAVDSSKLMADKCVALWRKHQTEYEKVAASTTGSTELKPNLKHLSMDGKVWFENWKGRQIVTFLQFKAGVDNSCAIVFLPGPRAFPESSSASQLWVKVNDLAPGWYVVHGT